MHSVEASETLMIQKAYTKNGKLDHDHDQGLVVLVTCIATPRNVWKLRGLEDLTRAYTKKKRLTHGLIVRAA